MRGANHQGNAANKEGIIEVDSVPQAQMQIDAEPYENGQNSKKKAKGEVFNPYLRRRMLSALEKSLAMSTSVKKRSLLGWLSLL